MDWQAIAGEFILTYQSVENNGCCVVTSIGLRLCCVNYSTRYSVCQCCVQAEVCVILAVKVLNGSQLA